MSEARTRRTRSSGRWITERLKVARQQRVVRFFVGAGSVLKEARIKYPLCDKVRGIVFGGVPFLLCLAIKAQCEVSVAETDNARNLEMDITHKGERRNYSLLMS